MLKPLIALSFILLSIPEAMAIDGNLPFNGSVTATCALTVGSAGILAPSLDFTSLASTNVGGTAGTVSVFSTSTAFAVSAIAPSAFTATPVGDSGSTTFSATYQGSGATTITATNGSTAKSVGVGTTNLSVNLSAVRSSGTFRAGVYSTEVIVRCE